MLPGQNEGLSLAACFPLASTNDSVPFLVSPHLEPGYPQDRSPILWRSA
jgi:hypothetical protein